MRRPLEVVGDIRIPEPCPVPWDRMVGSDYARQCDRCAETVYDLSRMTAADAAALFTGGGWPCVRVTRGPDGAVVTRDNPAAPGGRFHRLARRAVVIAGSWLGLVMASGCGSQCRQGKPLPPEGLKSSASPEQVPPPRPVNDHNPDAPNPEK